MPVLSDGIDVYLAAFAPRPDAVLDRILDKRLKDHVRHTGIQRVRRDLHLDLETVVEPRKLDLEILSQGIQAPVSTRSPVSQGSRTTFAADH
jgi:hypothetical protein